MLATTPHACPPWLLHAWPPLLWQAGQRLPFNLRHVGTQVTPGIDGLTRSVGQTVWAGRGPSGEEAGMAWDWVVLGCGIVAMADPMGVITNLRLMDPQGDVLPAGEAARHLNQIVHALPWQQQVEMAIGPEAPVATH